MNSIAAISSYGKPEWRGGMPYLQDGTSSYELKNDSKPSAEAEKVKALLYILNTTFSTGASSVFKQPVTSLKSPNAYVAYRRLQDDSLFKKIRAFSESPYLEGEAQELIRLSINDALTFLNDAPVKLAHPLASYSDDGEVVFTWKTENKRAEAAFPGDGSIEYTYRENGVFIPGAFACSAKEYPRDLLEYLE